jgi:hypothetical protein
MGPSRHGIVEFLQTWQISQAKPFGNRMQRGYLCHELIGNDVLRTLALERRTEGETVCGAVQSKERDEAMETAEIRQLATPLAETTY